MIATLVGAVLIGIMEAIKDVSTQINGQNDTANNSFCMVRVIDEDPTIGGAGRSAEIV